MVTQTEMQNGQDTVDTLSVPSLHFNARRTALTQTVHRDIFNSHFTRDRRAADIALVERFSRSRVWFDMYLRLINWVLINFALINWVLIKRKWRGINYHRLILINHIQL